MSTLQAHLRSEIDYKWEMQMRSHRNVIPELKRKRKHQTTFCFLGIIFRGMELKWVRNKAISGSTCTKI